MSASLNVMKRHIIPAIMNAFYELDPKVYVSLCVDYPGVIISPRIPVTSLREIKVEGDGNIRELTLNLSIAAVSDFLMVKEGINVTFRINEVPYTAYIPYEAVLYVFCPDSPELSESFPLSHLPASVPKTPQESKVETVQLNDGFGLTKRASHLRIVK